MSNSSSIHRGALLGAGLGLALSVLILILGILQGELFLATFLATALGAPISIALNRLGWFDQISNWVLYVLLVVPLNGAFVGAALVGIARALKRPTRREVIMNHGGV